MRKPKHLPLPNTKKNQIDEIIRVNHAGEYGAKRIYEGQLAILKQGKMHQEIKHMHQQELHHLKYFKKQLSEKRVRPTLLQPLWHALGFTMGAATAILGEKAAMACTVAVEGVIEEHYQFQLDELRTIVGEKELADNIKQFREEELEHRDSGIKNQAEDTFGYSFLYSAIQIATRVAIGLSKKI